MWMWIQILLTLLTLLTRTLGLHLDPTPSCNKNGEELPYFQLGEFYLRQGVGGRAEEDDEDWIHQTIHACILLSPSSSSSSSSSMSSLSDDLAIQAMRHFQSGRGKTLIQVAKTYVKHAHVSLNALSHTLNACVLMFNNADSREVILHVSLSVWPWNHYAALNYGYMLEWAGSACSARSLFEQLAFIAQHRGCLLQSAFTSAPLLWNEKDALLSQISIMSRAYSIIISRSPFHEEQQTLVDEGDPNEQVRELQLNAQYLGFSGGILAEAYILTLCFLFTSLNSTDYADIFHQKTVALDSAIVETNGTNGHRKRVRLGIIPENDANSSPSLCFIKILQRLGVNDAFDIVYFQRVESQSIFSHLMRGVASSVVTLDHQKGLEFNRQLIANQHIDILLYTALPTEKFTTFLSIARLAPIQIQFGTN